MQTRFLHGMILGLLLFFPLTGWCQTLELASIKLNQPDKRRGLPVMEALSLRASVREWSDKDVTLQDLSDLLWAANGINRPDSKKRTAASAMNSQDVDIYVFTTQGIYRYDALQHALIAVLAGDHRSDMVMARRGGPGALPGAPSAKPDSPPPPRPTAGPPAFAPVHLLLVSDNARFGGGTPEQKREWGAIDVGIVSQNIALFCASTGMVTRPRVSVDREKVQSLLRLTELHCPMLEHPVGYPE